MPTRRTDSFPARGDDGQDYIIDIYTDFVTAPTPEDPRAETARFQRPTAASRRYTVRSTAIPGLKIASPSATARIARRTSLGSAP